MKILYLVTKGNFGGAQRYVFDLATGLPSDEFEVTVAFGEGELLEQKLKEKNIRTIRLKNSGRDIKIFKDIKLFFEILNLLKKEKPDVIHLNSSKIGLIGALAIRIFNLTTKSYKLKAIFTAHGWAFNDSNFFILKFFLKFFQWLTVLLSDKTIAVSEKVKKGISNWHFINKKIEVIYNGIEKPNFLEKEEAREKLLPKNKDKIWIGTISELHKNKGLDILIEGIFPILKKDKNIILVIIGEGEERKNLEKLAEEKGLVNQIFFLGFIENASNFLKAFDIFTLTSKTEGLPYVLLEASLAELPIIASRVGGIPEILGEKSENLFEKENTKEFTEKLEKMLGEKNGNSSEKIKEKFSLEKMITETLKIYRNLN